MGHLYRRNQTWWMKYYKDGRAFYESSRTTNHKKAEGILKQREGAIAAGENVTPSHGRFKFDDALADYLTDQEVNDRVGIAKFKRRLELHLEPYFRGRRMTGIETADVRSYTLKRKRAGASNATINRELQALRRMFSLAIKAGKLLRKPHIPLLQEDNVVTRFLEPEQIAKVLPLLPRDLAHVVEFAWITSWRIAAEILTLEWSQLDFERGEIRLHPGMTKNKEGRLFPMNADLRRILEARKALKKEKQRLVFTRKGDPIVSMHKAFKAACKDAGVGYFTPHDLRRSAIRQMRRKGISETVAMKLSGHKTMSVFRRYDITSTDDLRDAAQRLETPTS
jgi:integrase